MKISRRQFFKYAGVSAAATALTVRPREAKAWGRKLEGAKKTFSVCPYCAVGCGTVVYSKGDEVLHIEGDPENPINRGALCPKGGSVLQLRANDRRVTKPLYRAPGASSWKEVEWDWAIDEIGKRVKATRDATFVAKNDKGETVNRTNAIASVGSAALDNEECYLYQKFLRGLGVVHIEHQARL